MAVVGRSIPIECFELPIRKPRMSNAIRVDSVAVKNMVPDLLISSFRIRDRHPTYCL